MSFFKNISLLLLLFACSTKVPDERTRLTAEISELETKVIGSFRDKIEKNYSTFLEDQKLLQKNPVFKPYKLNDFKAKKDAGNFLSSAKIGPTLLTKLQKYDHLNFMAFRKNYERSIRNLQEPDVATLMTLVKDKLLHVKSEKSALEILGELRHLARIFYTEETWVGAEKTLTLLGYEMQFVKKWNEDHKKELKWKVLSKKEYEAAERTIKVAPAFVEFSLPADWWNKITSNTPFVGECLSVRERLLPASYAYRFLKDDYPTYYTHYREHFQSLKKYCFSAAQPPRDISSKTGLLENVSVQEIYDSVVNDLNKSDEESNPKEVKELTLNTSPWSEDFFKKTDEITKLKKRRDGLKILASLTRDRFLDLEK